MAVLTAIRPRRAPDQVRLVRDGEAWLTASRDLVGALGLRAGMPMDDALVRAVEDAAADEHAWARVLRLVAIRPRTGRELRRALLSGGAGAERADRMVARAGDRGLIDDEGVARIVARRAVARGDAPAVVARRLAAAGVAVGAADAAVAEHAGEDLCLQAARAWVERRLGPAGALDARTHRRATRLLAGRGHGRAAVAEILGPPPAPDPEELAAARTELRRRFPAAPGDPRALARALAWCARRGIPTADARRLVATDGDGVCESPGPDGERGRGTDG